MARGEWIYYLGSDDRLTPHGISDLLAHEYPDIDLLGGSVFLLWPNGRQKNSCHGATEVVTKLTLLAVLQYNRPEGLI